MYAGGLIGYSIVRIISPTFLRAAAEPRPGDVSAASVAVNVALNLALVEVMGFAGLALGTSIAALLNAAVQLILLRRRLGGIEARRVTVDAGPAMIAAARSWPS